MERTEGLEPSLAGWRPAVLPLHHARVAEVGVEPTCVGYEPTEEPFLNSATNWCSRRDSNPHTAFAARLLKPLCMPIPPLEQALAPPGGIEPPPSRLEGARPIRWTTGALVRARGIEPLSSAYRAEALPLDDTREIIWRVRWESNPRGRGPAVLRTAAFTVQPRTRMVPDPGIEPSWSVDDCFTGSPRSIRV